MTTALDLPRTRQILEHDVERGLELGAQLYVSLGGPSAGAGEASRASGELAVGERAPGLPMRVDTLMIWLSSTKPVAAIALAQLWERGLFDLDDPIARHLPEFAQNGKEAITVRHALTHTGGFRLLNVGWPEADWDETIAFICRARPEPRWTAGEKAGYHMSSSWFILGELVRRLDGRHFRRYVREEIFEPLGMLDSWVGMPRERFLDYGDRLGRMYLTDPEAAAKEAEGGGRTPLERPWHREPYVVGCSPGGNGYGPMRELGRFYEMLLDRGHRDGARLLTPQSVEASTARHRVGMLDQTFGQKLDWGLGFIVNSEHYGAEHVAYGYGRHASRRTFGHSGFQSSTAFADPVHALVVAFVANGNPGEPRHTERNRAVVEAIYQDLELAAPAAPAES